MGRHQSGMKGNRIVLRRLVHSNISNSCPARLPARGSLSFFDRGDSMRRAIRSVVLIATLLSLGSVADAQRGGRGSDSIGGRGACLPLTPTKPLRFTTDEGTWLSLDLSPDGRT